MKLPARLKRRLCAAAWVVAGLGCAGANASEFDFFENRIRPVLVESCYGCHSAEADTSEGELTLDNRAGMLRGGRGGAAITPGKPAASRLITAIAYSDPALQMPPDGKLPDSVIADFREWIEQGAPDPRDGAAPLIDTTASRAESHWAFTSPKKTDQSIDPLLADKLQSQSLQPSPQADAAQQVRRLYFDLTGLPPTYDQLQAFASSSTPDAYQKLVDQLLASPQFGERWARHWLDIARFADTKGYVFTADRNYPNAYKYRDWVIQSFNDDLPIDQFLAYQIAADRLVSNEADHHHLSAQGYATLGRRFINNQHDIIADRIDVVFRGMMGLTVACARCHDHKFDPISDEDYYALYAMFDSSKEQQDDDLPPRLIDKEKPHNVGVFIRGSEHNRGKVVPRGFPQFFTSFADPVKAGSGRLELARAIASPQNPLTARVFVNRVWGHLFGDHLVDTPSDFGLRSRPPVQQDVLDQLAVEFVENDWSLKWLVRELVTTRAYRQSSEASPALAAADPENLLWGRAFLRRRDFESMRDALLCVADRLDSNVGGPSQEISKLHSGTQRRTLYAHIDRQNLPGVFRTFDFASPDAHSPRRLDTSTPQQTLFLLNSPLVQSVASDLAQTGADLEPEQRIALLYQRLLARDPSEVEVAAALDFLGQHEPKPPAADEWSFGYGELRQIESAAQVAFKPLGYFAESRWQSGQQFPDAEMGYVSLTSTGGHPGSDASRSSIRRWTAPVAGKLTIAGMLSRPSDKGDGVEGVVVSSRRGIVERWTVKQGVTPTEGRIGRVEPGDHVDFVVHCLGNPNYDSYDWRVSLELTTRDGRRTWSSERGFRGPVAPPLDMWAQLAQVLLVSNEFMFVD